MMFDSDSDVLDACLTECLKFVKGPIRVLEIGTWEGYTARGMKKFIEERGGTIDYWGIDPGKLHVLEKPFPEANVIAGKSEESFHLVDGFFHFIFVDGNHSRNAVILDTFNYEPMVHPQGFLVFHDTNPKCQLTGYEYEGPHIPEFGIAIREAWKMMGWPWSPWKLWMERYHPHHHQNGTTAFRRT
jgi:hypothetical protein